ncbi:MAG TPA: molybdopterin molybdotransferase MoeA [Syntrophothermus lipocalidus]|nr:molybdopterin molybdotransferase MoeA [Syntrophothermus lipocalidus]
MPEFFKVVRIEEAQALLRSSFPSPRIEEVELGEALGRVLATDVVSRENIPSFPRSTVDGYAVKAQDTFGSSESMPGFLTYKGEILMGAEPDIAVETGECAWIPTGGMLPPGADAAVMVEYTERLGDDTVLINRPVGPGENVVRVGEDVRQGEVVCRGGHWLRPQDLGVLASLGIVRVSVFCREGVGIISSGDEILPIEEVPGPGQVRDVNSYSLKGAVLEAGGRPQLYGIIPDDAGRLREVLGKALHDNRLVLLSGGSSVGYRDLSLEILMSLPGAELLFHGIAARPGKPTMAVRVDDRLVVGLPGHPVACYMMFLLLCRPLLGAPDPVKVRAVMKSAVASQAGRDDYLRVSLRDESEGLVAAPVYGKSGLIKIMARADGYVHIPYEKQGIKAGEPVVVTLF